MVAAFCLRLAWGMIAPMLVVGDGWRVAGKETHHPPPTTHHPPPRFFRVQYLTALGLLAAAGFFLFSEWSHAWTPAFVLSLVCCFAGSIVWHLDKAPLTTPILCVTVLALTWLMVAVEKSREGGNLLDAFTSAALLGSCVTAMLMGHSYLITPTMSLTPLMRLLSCIFATLALRVIETGVVMFLWFDHFGPSGFDIFDLVLITVRWLVGFIGVLVLTWMAWESARLRSTQSATGILYVVVVFCFVGELTNVIVSARPDPIRIGDHFDQPRP